MKISTIEQLGAQQSFTVTAAFLVVLVFVFISWFVASFMIPYEGGRDRSYVKRRWAFGIIGLIAVIGFYLCNEWFVMPDIIKPGLQSDFEETNQKCLFITSLGYLIVGVILMFLCKDKKYGTILFPNK